MQAPGGAEEAQSGGSVDRSSQPTVRLQEQLSSHDVAVGLTFVSPLRHLKVPVRAGERVFQKIAREAA